MAFLPKRNTWWQRHPLTTCALMPVLPQLLGSAFNIWYNGKVIEPLLHTPVLRDRFIDTVIVFNVLIYPLAVGAWIALVLSLLPAVRAAQENKLLNKEALMDARRRAINLPWFGSLLAGLAWLFCIPVFLGAFAWVQWPLPPGLLIHLPISFAVSAFISITHSFFLVELASHRLIFPLVFAGARPEQTPGAFSLSLRGRGLLWAISAGICPIGSLLLLSFAPSTPGTDSFWFALFVGSVGIAFGLCTALMINRLVAEPIDELSRAARAIASGNLDIQVSSHRPDEFGLLINEFNGMIQGLRDKEKLRHTFGLHVGKQTAEQILRRDPGLSGVEETVTVMFVDIRNFTARCRHSDPSRIVSLLNLFLTHMVAVVEKKHGGMINKFLGDGFMALFGAGGSLANHADAALAAAVDLTLEIDLVNNELVKRVEEPIQIGIGLHTGPAIIGSIGSPERLEFTAIGDTVNMASRVEGLTKVAGATILLTSEVRAMLHPDTRLRPLPAQSVKGVEQPVALYTVERPISA